MSASRIGQALGSASLAVGTPLRCMNAYGCLIYNYDDTARWSIVAWVPHGAIVSAAPPLPSPTSNVQGAWILVRAQTSIGPREGWILIKDLASVNLNPRVPFPQSEGNATLPHTTVPPSPVGPLGPVTRSSALLPAVGFAPAVYDAIGAAGTGLTSHLTPAFFRAVEQLAAWMRARGADVTAFDLLNVWLYESGVGRARQGHGGLPYYGLNMMAGSNLPSVGWTGSAAAYRDLPFEEQVPYVGRYYANTVAQNLGGDWRQVDSATALYVLNFLPAYARQAHNASFQFPDPYYADNASLDDNGDGHLSVGDLTGTLARARSQNSAYWNELVARQKSEGGTSSGSNLLAWMLGLGGLAVIGYGIWSERAVAAGHEGM